MKKKTSLRSNMDQYTMTHVRKDTFEKIKEISEITGIKLYRLIDVILIDYISKNNQTK